MYLQLRGTDTMPRDGGGTENIQTSANEAAVKIKYTNICKDVFPVLCIFTFVNTDFCTFLYSL